MVEVRLPGGLPEPDGLAREAAFGPVTGALERALAESGLVSRRVADQVSRILAVALDRLGGRDATVERVRALCSGDRQFLLLRLAAVLDEGPRWHTLHCRACEEVIQFPVDPAAVPVHEAGPEYPETMLELSCGRVRVRVPVGADEEAVAQSGDTAPEAGARVLLGRLLHDEAGSAVPPDRLSAEDVERVEDWLDAQMPRPVLEAHLDCPACGVEQAAAFDPVEWLVGDTSVLDREVHQLAWHYHWSEREILSLTRTRRRRYLHLIDQARGRYRAEDLLSGQAWG